jgi:hypothetical protein
MSLREKYRKLLSEIIPVGAVGAALLLGSTAPNAANDHPTRKLQPRTRSRSPNGSPPFARPCPPCPNPRARRSPLTEISSSPGEIGGATGGGVGARVGVGVGHGTIGGVIGKRGV